MDNAERKLTSHKGSKIKSYTISFKQTVAKFAKENSISPASWKFSLDRKRIREWMNNSSEWNIYKSTREGLDGGGCKPVITEIEENLL